MLTFTQAHAVSQTYAVALVIYCVAVYCCYLLVCQNTCTSILQKCIVFVAVLILLFDMCLSLRC